MDIEIRSVPARETAVIQLRVVPSELQGVMGPAIGEVFEQVGKQGIAPLPGWFDRTYSMGETWELEVGVAVPRAIRPAGRVVAGELPAGEAAVAVHAGPYEGLGATHEALGKWLIEQGREPAAAPWQVYLVGPETTDDFSGWRTEIVVPLKEDAAA